MQSIAKVTLITLLLFVGANLAIAQEHAKKDGRSGTPPDPTKMADQRTEEMAKSLDLNADQRARVQEINRKYAQQGRPGKPAAGAAAPTEAERKAMKEQRDATRAQKESELKTVLTPNQWETWEKNRKDHKGGKYGKTGDKSKKAKKGQTTPTKE